MIRGSFDIVTTTEALGWAYSPNQMEPVLVQAVLNQEVLGETQAGIYRPDLAAAGVGDGNAGFIIKFFRPIDPVYLPFISVKVRGGDAELPRSPWAGFKEFFSSMHTAFPAAGRHRSLSGGLWTDQTDAAALLAGKVRIGDISMPVLAVAEPLIHHGTAMIDTGNVPGIAEWRADLAGNTGDFLDDPIILSVLRAVLEDNPLAAKADWVEYAAAGFSQPSARNPAPSPGDCVELIVAFGENVALDVIRSSHTLPEFTVNGASRWITPATHEAGAAADAMGLLDRIALPAGMVALIGPGTIYKVHVEAGAVALRLLILPTRSRTVGIANGGMQMEEMRKSGVVVVI